MHGQKTIKPLVENIYEALFFRTCQIHDRNIQWGYDLIVSV
jgi:hypothetical protein